MGSSRVLNPESEAADYEVEEEEDCYLLLLHTLTLAALQSIC